MIDPSPAPELHHRRINEYIDRFGRERDLHLEPLSEQGVSQVQRGSAVVSIHVVPEQGVLLLLSRVMPAPARGGEALFRKLLELSFLTTGDAAFSISPRTGDVFLRCLRRLEGLDYEEFEDLVHTIATVADEWDDKLQKEFGHDA
jgi:hypothetical protein